MFLSVVTAIIVTIFGVQTHRAEQKRKAAAEVEEQARKVSDEAAWKEAEKKAVIATRRKAELDEEIALRAAAAEHERFLTKYVNTNITKRAGCQMVAVAVASERRDMNHGMGDNLVKRFQTEHVQLTDSFFKPELVTDGLFENTFNGATDLFNRLELAKTLDALLLARQTVRYETNAELNDIVTAAMDLEIVLLPVTGQIGSRSWKFSALGTGFRPGDARKQAEERIVKQIEADTKMSVPQPP